MCVPTYSAHKEFHLARMHQKNPEKVYVWTRDNMCGAMFLAALWPITLPAMGLDYLFTEGMKHPAPF